MKYLLLIRMVGGSEPHYMIKDNRYIYYDMYITIYGPHNRRLDLKLYFVFRLYYKSLIKYQIGNIIIHSFSFKNQNSYNDFTDKHRTII